MTYPVKRSQAAKKDNPVLNAASAYRRAHGAVHRRLNVSRSFVTRVARGEKRSRRVATELAAQYRSLRLPVPEFLSRQLARKSQEK